MPNDDLISRKALIEHLSTILISDVFPNWDNMEQKVKCSVGILGERFKLELEAAPTVGAAPVRHGRWVNPHMNKYGHPCHNCSECGFQASQKDRNYCPNCGAKMENPT